MASKSPRATARAAKRGSADNSRTDTRFLPVEAPYVEPTNFPKLQAKTNNQREALRMLEENRSVVVLRGSAGTGKSIVACYRAAKQLKSKNVTKVVLVRPAVSVGKSVGLLPGELHEKLAPYFAQTWAHIESFLGKGYTNYCREKGVIEMKAVEYLRGMSFQDCIVICEECQNFTFEEIEMMLTRIGENCQIIFTGDEKQNDLHKQGSGLPTAVNMIEKILQTHPEYMDDEDMDILDDEFGVVTFTPADVVRSGLCKSFVKIFYHS